MNTRRIVFLTILSMLMCSGPGWCLEAQGRPLSYKDSVGLALKNNTEVLTAHSRMGQSHGEKVRLWSDLFPKIDIAVAQQRVWWEYYNIGSVYLAGPYNQFDARLMVSQRIFDLTALAKAEAGRIKWEKARFEEDLAKEEITIATASDYIEALRAREQLKAAKEDITLAEHLVSLAKHQFDVGVASKIDLTRAETELARQKARYQQLKLDKYRADLKLKRIIRLPLSYNIVLTDTLENNGRSWMTIEEALRSAMEDRLEMRIARTDVDYSKEQLKAAESRRLPKIELTGEYGASGETPDKDLEHVGWGGVKVSLPVWESGDIKGDIEQQRQARQEMEIKFDDMRQRIEEDVRLAYETVRSSRTQVASRRRVVDLAREELTLAENRFKTGVGDNIEVINAQTVLAGARDAHVQALGQYEQACLNLYGALGNAGAFSLSGGNNKNIKTEGT